MFEGDWGCCPNKTALEFKEIIRYVPIKTILSLYSPYHEMDIRQFCDKMTELYLAAKPETNLKFLRQKAGFSQRELAELSGVPVRTIQQCEQRQNQRGQPIFPKYPGHYWLYQRKDGHLTINPEGAELVRLIFRKYGVEGKGSSIIAREMREAGYLTYSCGHPPPQWCKVSL